MIEVTEFRGRKVAVMGLARSGRSAVRALRAGGAEVIAWDDGERGRAAAAADGLTVAAPDSAAWDDIEALVMSPGIPHLHPTQHPAAARARALGRPVLCDVELLFRARPAARYCGITGTNGKSTTTTLIGHVLKRAGIGVEVGGNIGVPALDLAPLDADGVYVLELSSYQLELVPTLGCDVAVLLNISPDHLDRHGGMAGYVAAKQRIFEHPRGARVAVVGVDDAECRQIAFQLGAAGAHALRPISADGPRAGGVYVVDGALIDDVDGTARRVMDLRSVPTLPGKHNWQNAAAAYAACQAIGVPSETIVAALASYPGLAHRQELVADVEGVRFVNDSKATNADAAARALVCYDRIYWIAGGVAKEGGIEPLASHFPRIRRAYLIGAAAGAFARTLDGRAPITMSGDLASAVAQAAADSRGDQGAVVLLSPACASFDQFASFEARGDAFRTLARDIAARRGAGAAA
jgi:UDP-N-acetylmuramoylalanine--D-glutamate ligase